MSSWAGENKVNFFSNLERFDLASVFLQRPPGLRCPKTQCDNITVRQKYVWTYRYQTLKLETVTFSSLSLSLCTCDSELFVSPYLRLGVCLALVLRGLLSPWSHQSAWGPVKAISPILLLCLCQQLGAALHPHNLHTPHTFCSRTHWAKAGHLHKQPRPHDHKSLTELTVSQTTTHGIEPQNSMRKFAMLGDRLQGKQAIHKYINSCKRLVDDWANHIRVALACM